MERSKNQTSFDELRRLVRELRSHCNPSTDHPDDSAAAATSILESIDEWIALAEQRRDQSGSIIESARDAFIAIDSGGCITEWNREAERIFGWSKEEVVGRPVEETVIPVEQRAAHRAGLRRFLETGEGPVVGRRIEVLALRRDGTQFPAELTVLEPQCIGRSIGINAFIRDITRRKEAVDALRQSEALYHSLVDVLPINVSRTDLDGRITFVNQPFCELVQMNSEDLIGRTNHDINPPELADKFRRVDQHVAATGEVFHAIEENTEDGKSTFFEVWKVPVRDAAGKIAGTQAVFSDVTEREENRAALSRERDLLRTLMDSLPDLIYVKDDAGRFVTVNRAMLNLWGNPAPESVVGKTPFEFTREDLAAAYVSEDHEVLKHGTSIVDREELVIGRNGEQLVYSTTKVPLHNPDGQVSGLVGIDRNITSRKRDEEKLRQAQQAADAANRAKSDFLANMSHEIRTPMNAVIGMSELLLDSGLESSERDYVRMIHESGESLLAIINDILDFSKIEAGKFDLEAIAFSLQDRLGDTMQSLAFRAHKKHLELAFHVANDVPDLLIGDPGRLRQILLNLVGNAIKFTESGEVVVNVTSVSRNDDSVVLQVSVRDTGVGIPDDRIDRIFDAFEQADSSTTRRFGGTGLGLAISSRIVSLMQGRVWVKSELGRGSTFYFTAQFELTDDDARAPVRPHLNRVTGMRVLIVDDNTTNRRILEDIVRARGMVPLLAASAAEAIRILQEASAKGSDVPLVLSDVNMPDVDGFTLAEEIRKNVDLSEVVIIMLTSGGRTIDKQRSIDLGIAAHLMKPVKQSDLFDAIVRAFEVTGPEADSARISTFDSPSSMPSLRILLAEDAVANQMLAIGLLEKKWKHRVTVANNGNEAIDLLSSRPFDLILMDIQMPELDGLEATAAIRRLESQGQLPRQPCSHIPIIAMTAHAMKGDRERCLNAGMDGYVSKPIRAAELKESIQQLFDSDAGSADPKSPPTETMPTETMPTTDSSAIDESTDAGGRKLINWPDALEAVLGDQDLLRAVVRAFLEECPRHVRQLGEAIDQRDVKTAHRLAHLIKGITSTLAIPTAVETAQRLEDMCAAAELTDAADVLHTLDRHLKEVSGVLTDYVTGDFEPGRIAEERTGRYV